MILVPYNASAKDAIQIAMGWVELWARSGSEVASAAITSGDDVWTPERLEFTLSSYRSSELYPTIHNFAVTSPYTAIIDKHIPYQKMEWHSSDKTALVGSVYLDLPLNGQWSDLQADFDLWKGSILTEDYLMTLSEIQCWEQYWAEEEP